ncbi:hypothetical protein AMTRI_Chr10g2660 [Amborella trichopoda]
MEILLLLLVKGHVLDHFVYNLIIERFSYCNLQIWEDATGVILEMTQFGLDLDSLTCNTVIKSFCNVGLLSHSILVLEEMIAREIPTNIETYDLLINTLYKEGRMDMALELLDCLFSKDPIFIIGLRKVGFRDRCRKFIQRRGVALILASVSTSNKNDTKNIFIYYDN